MKIKVTRQKRPDRIEAKWGVYNVVLEEEGGVRIWVYRRYGCETVVFPLSEIDNLIKALEEMKK